MIMYDGTEYDEICSSHLILILPLHFPTFILCILYCKGHIWPWITSDMRWNKYTQGVRNCGADTFGFSFYLVSFNYKRPTNPRYCA